MIIIFNIKIGSITPILKIKTATAQPPRWRLFLCLNNVINIRATRQANELSPVPLSKRNQCPHTHAGFATAGTDCISNRHPYVENDSLIPSSSQSIDRYYQSVYSPDTLYAYLIYSYPCTGSCDFQDFGLQIL